ncbi:hypothetical protein JCM17961_15930 [Endothiovibrio diazotrophicus]
MSLIENELTISYWIKKRLNSFGGGGPNRWDWDGKAWWSGVSSNNEVGFSVADEYFVAGGESGHEASATQRMILPDNEWTLVTQVFKGGLYKGYLNGELKVQETLPIQTINSNPGEPIRIGKQGDTCCNDHLQATIDEVRIYSRTLIETEIQQLYAEGPQPPNQDPTAVIALSPTSGEAPLSITLDGTGSTDDGQIVEYAWTTSNGLTFSGNSAQATFAMEGIYSVTLTVTDDRGATGIATQSVEVRPAGYGVPTAEISVDHAEGDAPLTVTFDGSRSADQDGSIMTYRWSSSDGRSSLGSLASFTFDQPGTYVVTLVVTDNDGNSGTAEETVVVGMPLTPVFTVSQVEGAAPLTVDVDATGSEPASEIINYSWNTSDHQVGLGPTASFTFDQEGVYTITLSVIDSTGETATIGKEVIVLPSESSSLVSYDATARIGPQVIAGGVSPSMIDLSDSEFDIVAVVRPGILPIQTVSFRSTNGDFAMVMSPAGVLPNGDEVYKTTYVFPRGSFGITTLSTAWGGDEGQFNIEAIDQGAQRSHAFPALRWGNYPEQTAAGQGAQPLGYNATRRLAPQVIMGGYSPALLDVADSAFDVIAVIREGALPIEQVTLSQNAGSFSQLMNEAGVLDNGDKVYKMTFTYQRGSFQTGTVMKALWGDQMGQFNIRAVDQGQQHTHAFPDIEFGNYPAR